MNKKLIVPILIAVIIATVGYGAVTTYAQDTPNPHDTLIQKLVQKFGLQETEVQAVFDEVQAQHHAAMQAKMEERLNQAVSEGKLTEAQKQVVLAKMAELKRQMETNREQFQSMTPEERYETAKKHHAELEAWAQQQGIDLEYLKFTMKVPFGAGKGMWHMMK